jgi:hypothetical protein
MKRARPRENVILADAFKIYSGPGGKFKAHVDTPRGPDQFGSLIVCLPSAHQGTYSFSGDGQD